MVSKLVVNQAVTTQVVEGVFYVEADYGYDRG